MSDGERKIKKERENNCMKKLNFLVYLKILNMLHGTVLQLTLLNYRNICCLGASKTTVPAADVPMSGTSEITNPSQESVLNPSLITLSRETSQQFKKVNYQGGKWYY